MTSACARRRKQMRNGLKLIKFAKNSTMLDDAPWEWGSTGGWCNGMPDFFQVHTGARGTRVAAALLAARGLPLAWLWSCKQHEERLAKRSSLAPSGGCSSSLERLLAPCSENDSDSMNVI